MWMDHDKYIWNFADISYNIVIVHKNMGGWYSGVDIGHDRGV